MMRRIWLTVALLAGLAGCAADHRHDSLAASRYQPDAYLRAAAPTSYPSEYDIPAPPGPGTQPR